MSAVNGTTPPLQTIDAIHKKIAFFKWKRRGGNSEEFLEQQQITCKEIIIQKLKEVSGVITKEQQASHSTLDLITKEFEHLDPLTVSAEKVVALKLMIESLKLNHQDLSGHLDVVLTNLAALSNQKSVVGKQIDQLRKTKDDTPFSGQQALLDIGKQMSHAAAKK